MAPSVPSAADAYTALSSYKAPDAGSVLTQAQGQAGLPAAQQRVSDLQGSVKNLQSSLDAVDPSVTGRTSGTFTTEGQRSALVNKEQAPIQTNLTSASGDLNTATGNLNTANANANTYASAILGQNQQQYQQLLDQYNAAAAEEKQQETVREYNATLADQQAQEAAAAKVAAGGTSAGTGNGATPASNTPDPTKAKNLSGGKSQQDAADAVQSLLLSNNANLIKSTVSAIAKSAQYGNTYDQYKLELLQTPEFTKLYKGQIAIPDEGLSY